MEKRSHILTSLQSNRRAMNAMLGSVIDATGRTRVDIERCHPRPLTAFRRGDAQNCDVRLAVQLSPGLDRSSCEQGEQTSNACILQGLSSR